MATRITGNAIPDLTIMANENMIQGSQLIRDTMNVHITSRRTLEIKRIDSESLDGSALLERPVYGNPVQVQLAPDRVNILLKEVSAVTSIDRQQIEEDEIEKMQYEEEAVRTSVLQVMDRYYNDYNTVLTTAGNYVAAREQAAGTAWSVSATATPYKNVWDLLTKLSNTGKRPRTDAGWILLLSENLVDEVVATTDYQNRTDKVGFTESRDIRANLEFYFKLRVQILEGYYYGKNGTKKFSNDLAVLIYKDMENSSANGIIGNRNFAMDNSTFAWSLKALDTGLDERTNTPVRVPISDAVIQFNRPIVKASSYWSADGESQKNIKCLTDGALFINVINRLGRVTGV